MQRHSSIDETGSLHQPNTGISGSRYVGEIVSGGTPLASWMLPKPLSGKNGPLAYQTQCPGEEISISREIVKFAALVDLSLRPAITSSGTCQLHTTDLLAKRDVLPLVTRHSIR